MSFKFEFEHYDGKKVSKLVLEGLPETADEILKMVHDARKHGLEVKGIVLGPEEYLGLVGFLANQNKYSTQAQVNNIGGIGNFMGLDVSLKHTPGVDLLFQNDVGMAARLIHQLPHFKVVRDKSK